MKIHRVIRFKREPLNKGDSKEREEAIRVNQDASENIQQEECRPSPKLKLPKEFNDANMQLRTCIRLAFEERNKENLFGVFGPDAERMINELKRDVINRRDCIVSLTYSSEFGNIKSYEELCDYIARGLQQMSGEEFIEGYTSEEIISVIIDLYKIGLGDTWGRSQKVFILINFEIMNLEILRKLSSLQSSDLIILVWSNETRDGIEDFFYDGNFIFANLT